MRVGTPEFRPQSQLSSIPCLGAKLHALISSKDEGEDYYHLPPPPQALAGQWAETLGEVSQSQLVLSSW